MFRKYGFVGILLIIVAYIMNLTKTIPADPFGLILPQYFFIIGAFLFLDALNFNLNKNSILNRLRKKDFLIFKLIFVGLIIGLIFEVYGVFISNLWYSYFQFWSLERQLIHYPSGLLVGYGLPALVYYSLYKVLAKFINFRTFKKSIKLNNAFFKFLLILGLIFLSIPILLYSSSLNWDPILRGILFGFCLLGLWFVLEYFENKSHRSTFLTTLLQGNWKPLSILLISSFIISVSWENLDFMRHSWTYHNLPFMNVVVFGLPIMIILGWPFLFICYFSAYKIIFKDNEEIW
ncbi:hypothetical protein CL618_01060 [archaeon]|nr:hypothetical protein [archaeon]|tara:strand:- start:778 stop:1650 length:873 start_codon:yes stop_codon:yes gene_type:complete